MRKCAAQVFFKANGPSPELVNQIGDCVFPEPIDPWEDYSSAIMFTFTVITTIGAALSNGGAPENESLQATVT